MKITKTNCLKMPIHVDMTVEEANVLRLILTLNISIPTQLLQNFGKPQYKTLWNYDQECVDAFFDSSSNDSHLNQLKTFLGVNK